MSKDQPKRKVGRPRVKDNRPLLPQLSGPEELETGKNYHQKFHCNGNLLYKTDPEKYGRIASMLSEGGPIGRIANLLGTSPHMVRAVQVREGGTIATAKQYVAEILMTTNMVAAEKLLEYVVNDEIPAATLPIALGIMIDKMQTLSGEATQVIQVKREMTVSEFNTMIKELPKAEQVIDLPTNPEPKS